MQLKRREFLLAAGMSMISATDSVFAQPAYPSRPIKFICPFAAGSSTDVFSRQVCDKLGDILGQRVIVENRAGAGGVAGANAVARSDPDGYTIGLGANSSHAGALYLQKNLPYDPVKDFAPIALMGIQPSALIVNAKLGANSVEELVAILKSNPGKYSYGHTGRGVTSHLAGETFKRLAKVDVVGVPYTGGQAITDLLAGVVQFMFYPTAPIKGALEAGDLKALATTNTERLSLFYPELPTMFEKGYPGLTFPSWLAAYAPAGTPRSVIERLAKAYDEALADKKLSELMIATGTLPSFKSPADLAAMQKAEIARYKEVIEFVGLTSE
jgi:tripartite-type tricarboxylate transporter receptor subunit TctC